MNKKKLIAAIAVIGSTACVLGAACSHTHEYGEEWLKDEAYHWHECTSDDGAITDPVAHTYGSWTVTLTATEERAGEQKRECTVCGYEQTEVIGQLAHTHKYGEEWSNDEADHWKDCTADDDNKGYLAAHTYGEWEEVTEATEQAAGLKKQTCSVCGYVNEEVIPKLDHTHTYATAWTHDETNHWHKCNKTDCSSVSDTAKHTLEETVTKAATVDEAGVKKIECTVCDYEKTEPITMLASKQYKVTVLDASGEPVEGVTVKLGKYSAVTDEEGLATVKAELGEYTLLLEGLTEGLKYDDSLTLSATHSEATVWVAAPSGRGGSHEGNAAPARTGAFAITLSAVEDDIMPGNYYLAEQYFKLQASGAAKKYTVTALCSHALISSMESGIDMLDEKGESYSVVLEAGQSSIFSVSSTDEEIEAGFTRTVFFLIEEDEAPAAGVKERPAKAVEGENGKPAELEGDSVYLALDYATFGSYAKVTFGEGVTVTDIGLNINAAGEELESGATVRLSEYSNYYLKLSFVDATSKVTLEKYYLPGSAQNPLTAKADGTANTANFSVEEGIYEQWFTLTVAESGLYTLATDSNTSYLSVYEDLEDEPIRVSGMGADLVMLHLTAGTPVYILAEDNDSNDYTFTCTQFNEIDLGNDIAAPLEITASADYKVFFEVDAAANQNSEGKKKYYKYTAEESSSFTVTYVKTTGFTNIVSVNFYRNAEFIADGIPPVTDLTSETVLVSKGESLYFMLDSKTKQELDTTFNVKIEPLPAHSYVITVTDGEQTFDGVTVTLMNGEEEAASATTVEGKATMSAVPDNFTVKLTNLLSGYEYFAEYHSLEINSDTVTNYEVKIYELKDYSVKVKLPNSEEKDLTGIQVTFTNAVTGTFTATTGEDGIATITNKLPPMAASNDGTLGTGEYTVTLTLPDSLKEDYTYKGTAIILTSSNVSTEVSLTAVTTYKITLTYDDGGETKKVTKGTEVQFIVVSNSEVVATGIVGDNGVVELKMNLDTSTNYKVVLNNNFVAIKQVKGNIEAETTVACAYVRNSDNLVTGAKNATLAYNDGNGSAALSIGENPVSMGTTAYNFSFTAEQDGVYTFTYADITTSNGIFSGAYLNGGGANEKIFTVSTSKGITNTCPDKLKYKDDDAIKNNSNKVKGYTKITMQLAAGDVFIIVADLSGYGYITVSDPAPIPAETPEE